MITVNENILNTLTEPVRRVNARVELYNCSTLQNDGYNRELLATFTGKDALIDFKVERIADDGKFFGFGICQKLTVNLLDTERIINIHKGQVLEVSFAIENSYTYPCALFQVEEVIRDENNNSLKIIAYDFLYKAGEHRVSELNLTEYTPRSFIAACAFLLNLPIKIEVEDPVFDLPYPTGANFDGSETLREALNEVAEATQSIFFVDWDWRLTFRRLKKDGEPVLHIDRENYFELKNKTERTLAAICHATELGDNVEVSTGEPGAVQYIRNNAFWELRDDIGTLLENALAATAGITISQFDCSWRGNYALEIGDKITFETKNGDILVAYLLNDTLTYNGGLKEQTEWTFTEHNAETASNPVNLGDALKQTFARVNKAEGYIELVAQETTEALEQTTEEIASLRIQADSIASEVERVETKLDGNVTTLNSTIQQTAESITSEVSRVETKLDGTTSTLSSQIEQNADNIELKVSKDKIISAINLSTESIDISADKVNLNGYVTVTDLAGNGTTTIDGSNIKTGSIAAERLNLTGAITFGDLDSSAQSKINGIESTADSAYDIAVDAYWMAADSGVPSYIKSTYIDPVEIKSPTITGNEIKVYNTFQTLASSGDTNFITGYVGAAKGMTNDNETTYGVALASDWTANSYDVSENYVIVTNAGARMEGGENRIYVTPTGLWLKTTNGKTWVDNINLTDFLGGMPTSSIASEGMADFVVEQGYSGIWSYRKWNSGMAECWARKAVSTTINKAWGSLYTSGPLAEEDFPFTFASVPVVTATPYNNGAGVMIMAAGEWNPPTVYSTGSYELVRAVAATSSTSYGINYHVIGRWRIEEP